MEIVIYRRQRVDHGEQSDTTYLVLKFAYCVVGPSEFFTQRFSIERSRTASPGAVLQRANLWANMHCSGCLWNRTIGAHRVSCRHINWPIKALLTTWWQQLNSNRVLLISFCWRKLTVELWIEFARIWFQWSDSSTAIFGLDNSLAPNWLQGIIRTKRVHCTVV